MTRLLSGLVLIVGMLGAVWYAPPAVFLIVIGLILVAACVELAGLFAQSLARTRHRLLSQGGEGEPGYWALPVALESGMKDVRAYAKKKDVETECAFEGGRHCEYRLRWQHVSRPTEVFPDAAGPSIAIFTPPPPPHAASRPRSARRPGPRRPAEAP